MTPTRERDIVDYLQAQADRVEVTSTLEAIEHDLVYLPRADQRSEPRRLAPLLAVASVAVVIGGLALVGRGSDTPASTSSGRALDTLVEPQASVASESTGIEPAPASTTPALDTTADTPAPAGPEPSVTDPTPVPLPDGAVLNGVSPTCTATTDEVVFRCSVAAFPEPIGTLDLTGYVTSIVDDTSHVSGGCRAVDPEATEYLCYIGQRAVDEQIIGQAYLGEPASREYGAG